MTDPEGIGKRPGNSLRMADIARLAGVDVSTVSRALADSNRLPFETKQRIVKIVEETGYVVNRSARTLRAGLSNQILILIPDIAAAYYPEIVKGAEDVLAEHGVSVLLGSTMRNGKRDIERELGLGKQLLDGTVDGILTITGSLPENVLAVPSYDRKIVALSRTVSGVPNIGIDNHAAATEMMQYLFDAGHRSIVHIGGPEGSRIFDIRADVYSRLMGRMGLHDSIRTIRAERFDAQSGIDIASEVLAGKHGSPTALFCAADELAVGAMVAARQLGARVPEDVSITGFDDLSLASLVQPSLTTIRIPRIEVGRRGAEMLWGSIYAGSSCSPDTIVPHLLVERESVSTPPP